MRAALRGTEIFFDVEGAGLVPDGLAFREKPPALIIHGGPGGDHSGFKPAFTPLSDHLQLIYFDHRGQGRSGRGDPARYTLDENVEDMEALRRHLGAGPVVSIGTSYGGMVAMAHAARYPEAVSHLVLAVTAAHGGFMARAQEIVRERGTAAQQQAFDALSAGRFRTADEVQAYFDVMGPLYSRKYDAAAASSVRGRAIYSPEPLNRAFAPDGFLRTMDLRPELPQITAPVLILAGRHDWICPPQFSEEIHTLLPGSTLRMLEESSHSLRVDEPERLRAEIVAFVTPVKEHEPARGAADAGPAPRPDDARDSRTG